VIPPEFGACAALIIAITGEPAGFYSAKPFLPEHIGDNDEPLAKAFTKTLSLCGARETSPSDITL
jgi:hypothetical protein